MSTLIRPTLLTEVDSLEQMLAERMGLMRLISHLDRLGASIDEKIRFTYETHVNRGITRLTWSTVALAVVTIVQGVLDFVLK